MSTTYLSEKTEKILDDRLCHLKSKQAQINHRYEIIAFTNYVKKDFLNIERQDVIDYLQNLLKQKRTPETVKGKLSVLRGMARECDRQLKSDMVHTVFSRIGLGTDKTEYTEKDLADLNDVDKLLEHVLGSGNEQLAVIIALALECAMPSREIIGLKIGEVHTNELGQPYIRIGTKHEDYMGTQKTFIKEIPLKIDTAKAINELVGKRPGFRLSDPVFIDKWGRPLSARGLQIMVSDAGKAAGIPVERAITLTKLNNLAVVSMRKGGAGDNELASALGHVPSWITRYNSITKDFQLSPVMCNHISVVFD